MPLPSFRYHPNPLQSGSLVSSDRKCLCCGQPRGYIYTGPVYAERDDLEEALCPWCIADGSAHEKFDASFVDENAMEDDIDPEVRDEIAYRTPGFASWQGEEWLACCDSAMAFLEPVGSAEIRERYPDLEGSLMSYIVYDLNISGSAATRMLHSLHRDKGPTAYVFRCLQCETAKAFIDGIFDVEN